MKWILPKEIRLDRGFALNWFRELSEEFVERGSGRECNHDRLGDQLPQRLPLGDPSCAVVFFGGVQGGEELLAVQADRVAKRLEVLFRDLELKAVFCTLDDFGCECHIVPLDGSILQPCRPRDNLKLIEAGP